ncbi:MAG: RluA family pseudouridine synthase [Oscillospiraceae bacterium]|nr:RluA family pseudouridine synthase [Oscillospiraceae bacterium]
MKTFLISANDAGQRLDKFLTKAVPLLPQPLLYKYIRLKRIKCNKKRCEISTRLQEGDLLELYINDEFFTPPVAEKAFFRAGSQLEVLYEDENVLLVNKPAGLIVHEDDKEAFDTLINRILKYLYEKKEYDPQQENSFVPALCNRIDRNTSGIVLAAKNAEALRTLNQKIKDREIEKRYLCVVHGKMPRQQETLTAYLKKDADKNQVRVYDQPLPGGRTIRTAYQVLAEKDGLSLLKIDLLTGRTHQIRAHMAYLGHPLLGDSKYGKNREDRQMGYRFQALCAYQMTFSFAEDGGPLAYLKGRTVTVPQVDFVEALFPGQSGKR